MFEFNIVDCSLYVSYVHTYILAEINGFTDDLYGNVTPIEIISSLGSLWNFGPGHQDTHELFHVILSALDAEIQPANRVCYIKLFLQYIYIHIVIHCMY